MYRWKPGPVARYKKTELCRTCAKLKNVCQTCVLDLQYGLPVQVRDSVLREEDRIDLPASAVGKAFMIEQYERKMEAGVTASSASSADPTALFAPLDPASSSSLTSHGTSALSTAYSKLTHKDATLSRLTRPAPYYKRNEAHLCTFFARGECNRGQLCPFRHEMPPPPSALSKQNIQDRYAGRNDPVALKMLGRVKGGGRVDNGGLVPPDDASVTTLWVGGVEGEGGVVEGELQGVFGVYGALRRVHVLPAKRCAFVSFVTRVGAEEAAAKGGEEAGAKGWTLKWAKGKPKGEEGGGTPAGPAGKAVAEGGPPVAPPPGMSAGMGSSATAAAAAVSTVSPAVNVVFPLLPPPPGMALPSYPSQHPQQSAARFTVDT